MRCLAVKIHEGLVLRPWSIIRTTSLFSHGSIKRKGRGMPLEEAHFKKCAIYGATKVYPKNHMAPILRLWCVDPLSASTAPQHT